MRLLADAVGAVRRLILRCLVPPWVVVDHNVGCRQIQTRSACLQRDQKNRGAACVECFDHCSPFFPGRRALKREIRNMQRVQPLTHPIKHGGELRKQQDLMTVFRHRLAQFHAGIQLARWTFEIFKTEPRIAAHLPQPGQRGENLQFALLVSEICNGGLHTGVIELLFLLGQRYLSNIFFLGRKLLEDILFQPAQQKRLHQPPQLGNRVRVFRLEDRLFQFFAERMACVEISGHEKIEQVPELTEPVFNRRSRQDKPLPARKTLDGLGRERSGVFDVLGLVEHAAVKLQLRIRFNILPDKLIGRDPHVEFCARSTQTFTLGSISQDQLIAQLRSKFLQLVSPVVDQ